MVVFFSGINAIAVAAIKGREQFGFSFFIALALDNSQAVIDVHKKTHPKILVRLHTLGVSYKRTEAIVHEVIPRDKICFCYMHASPDCTGGSIAIDNCIKNIVADEALVQRLRQSALTWETPKGGFSIMCGISAKTLAPYALMSHPLYGALWRALKKKVLELNKGRARGELLTNWRVTIGVPTPTHGTSRIMTTVQRIASPVAFK